jgi:predicted DNA-binding transcriptional regulator AlpA
MSNPDQTSPLWLTSTQVRARCGGHKGMMANSTFWLLVKQGRLPRPRHPFGPDLPRWLLSDLEEHEKQAMGATNA